MCSDRQVSQDDERFWYTEKILEIRWWIIWCAWDIAQLDKLKDEQDNLRLESEAFKVMRKFQKEIKEILGKGNNLDVLVLKDKIHSLGWDGSLVDCWPHGAIGTWREYALWAMSALKYRHPEIGNETLCRMSVAAAHEFDTKTWGNFVYYWI